MLVHVLDHVPQCYSADDGAVIASVLRGALNRNTNVILSFDGVADVPSSFINAALVSLLDDFSFQKIRAIVSIVDANAQIGEMVHRCFANAERHFAAA